MMEATTNPEARRALQKAHAERGEAVSAMWRWLFPRTSR